MVRIITDSTCSIPAALRESLGIGVVSLFVNWRGNEQLEGDMDLDAFYEDIYEMVDDIPTSSQPSQESLRTVMEDAFAQGHDVLMMLLSSKLSGTFETVARVAKEASAKYPGRSISVVDSLSTCLELGWPVIAAATAAKEGADLDECLEKANRSLRSTRFVFSPESLRFLQAGGRIGRASALIGSIVNIAPILTVKDGFATTYAKVRTQRKAMAKMVDIFKEDIQAFGFKNVMVHYIGSRVPAEKWAKEVVEPLVGREVPVAPASPVIGVHVGPAYGLAYECANPIPGKFSGSGPEVVTCRG